MSIASAGDFEVYVTQPYPCWVRLSYAGEQVFSISHSQLCDLEYVVKRAMALARQSLGKDAGEV